MKTNQTNVYKAGTFENKIAAIYSHNLTLIGDRGFGPMESILRNLLFSGFKGNESETHIDWVHAADLIAKFFPESAAEINAIKAAHGIA